MTVYLVGAGPGDPGLLTRRGADVLARAEVVVHDRLSEISLLDLAPPNAERIDVGKSPGSPVAQEEINALLVEHGRRRREVVRLKGGDPFVFGRGGEEALALAAVEDTPSRRAVEAERAWLAEVGGGCDLPVGAHATLAEDGRITLTAVLATPDGRIVLRDSAEGDDPDELGRRLARHLLDQAGGAFLLADLR